MRPKNPDISGFWVDFVPGKPLTFALSRRYHRFESGWGHNRSAELSSVAGRRGFRFRASAAISGRARRPRMAVLALKRLSSRVQASGGEKRFDLIEFFVMLGDSDAQVVSALQIHPETSEVPGARDRRGAVSGEIARLPCMSSLKRRAGTEMVCF